MILTEIQIQSLIVCAVTILVAAVIGYVMIRIEREEEKARRERILDGIARREEKRWTSL